MSQCWQNYNGINTADNWFKTELIFGGLTNSYTSYMSGGANATQIRLYYQTWKTGIGFSPWYNIGWIYPVTGGNSATRNITIMNGNSPGDDAAVSTYVGNYVSFKWDSCNWSAITDVPDEKYEYFLYAFEIYVAGVPVLQNVFANDNQSGFTGSGYHYNYFCPYPNISVASTTSSSITITRTGNSGFNTLSTFMEASYYNDYTFKFYNINDIESAISAGVPVYLWGAGGSGTQRCYPSKTLSGNNITISGIPQGSHQLVEAGATTPDSKYSLLNLVNVYNKYATPTTSYFYSDNTVIYYNFNSVAGATGYGIDLYKAGVHQAYNGGSSTSGTFTGLTPNTAYEIRYYAYGGNPSSDLGYSYTTTSYTTPGMPSNISLAQPQASLSVNVTYQWGSNATSMDFRWSTDQATWTEYTSQTNNLYPAANYNVGVATIGLKYFQVRSRRLELGYTTTSAWSSSYSINIINNLRPSSFTWTSTPTSGGDFLYASDYNSLKTKINAFRIYTSLSTYSFSYTVAAGGDIYAAHVNDLITAISSIPGRTISLPSSVSIGDDIYASTWTTIANSLNSTP